MQLGYDLIHRIDAKFINVSNSDGERQSERREETPYRNRNSSASRDLNEQTRSSEHLAESCSVCLSAGTSTASFVSAAPALSLGKRKHESEESSDKKGKKKAKIEEEKEEEKEAEEEKAEEVEEAEEAEEPIVGLPMGHHHPSLLHHHHNSSPHHNSYLLLHHQEPPPHGEGRC